MIHHHRPLICGYVIDKFGYLVVIIIVITCRYLFVVVVVVVVMMGLRHVSATVGASFLSLLLSAHLAVTGEAGVKSV